jgi:hypothetical protein
VGWIGMSIDPPPFSAKAGAVIFFPDTWLTKTTTVPASISAKATLTACGVWLT